MSNFFDGLKTAESYEHGKGFVRDQTYHVEIVGYIPEKSTQRSGNMTLIECRVIASSSPSAPPGTKLVRFRKHAPIAAAQSEMIGFWKSVFGFTGSKEHTDAFNAQYRPHIGTYSQNAQYCVGKRLTIRTVTATAKDGGHKYVRHDWSPLEVGPDGQPVELRQQPDPEPLQDDRQQAQQPGPQMPPGGYASYQAPQMQPWAQMQQPMPMQMQAPPPMQMQQPMPMQMQAPPPMQMQQPVPMQHAPVMAQQYAPNVAPQHIPNAAVPVLLQKLPDNWPANAPVPPGFTR